MPALLKSLRPAFPFALSALATLGFAQIPAPKPPSNAANARTTSPLIGQCLDPSGEPIAGAEVTVIWNPLHHPALAPAGVAKGAASNRGYFAIPAPVGQPLYVWFIGPAATSDSEPPTASSPSGWISEVTPCAVGIERFEVHADGKQAAAAAKRNLTIQGIDAWAEHAPFTLRVHPIAQVDYAIATAVQDGIAAMPPLPAGRLAFELVASNGTPLYVWTSSNRPVKLSLPAPVKVPVRVVGQDGKPLAGATIRHRLLGWYSSGLGRHIRPFDRVAGQTGADGKVELMLPLRADPLTDDNADMVLFADLPGYASNHSGRQRKGIFLDGKVVTTDEPIDAFTFTLSPAGANTATVPVAPSEGLDRAVVSWTSKIARNNGWIHLPCEAVLTIDREGGLDLGCLPSDAYELHFTLPFAQPTGVSPHSTPPRDGARVGEGLRDVEITLARADGAPCAGTSILALIHQGNSLDIDRCNVATVTDSRGHAELSLDNGEWFLVAVAPEGYAVAIATAPCEMTLKPFETMRAIVLDGTGAPVAGATVDHTGSGWSNTQNGAEQVALNAVAGWIARNYTDRSTADDGSFSVPVLPRQGLSWTLTISKDGFENTQVKLEPTEGEPAIITLGRKENG